MNYRIEYEDGSTSEDFLSEAEAARAGLEQGELDAWIWGTDGNAVATVRESVHELGLDEGDQIR